MKGTALRRIAAIVLRQFYLLRVSIVRVLPLFAWVAVNIVLWGFITRYLNEITPTGLDFVPILLGAVLLWDFFARVMYGMTTAFFEDVWARNFLNLFSTPISTAEYVGGLVLTTIATSSVGLTVMLVLATMVFGLSFAAFGAMFVPFVLVLFLFGIGLGVLAIAMVLRLGPASEWLVWPIPAFITPFAGVFYPLEILPEWMQVVGYALPPAYVFEGMRTIIAGDPFALGDLAWGAGLAGAYVLAAGWVFTRVYGYTVRTGLMARYSAESVN